MSKKGVYAAKDGRVVQYRSGWELSFMKWLDMSDAVDSWAYEPFEIPYVASERSSKIRIYVPDFVVAWSDGSTCVIEIKPLRRINHKVRKKAEAAAEFSAEIDSTFAIMTEIELKQIGVKL